MSRNSPNTILLIKTIRIWSNNYIIVCLGNRLIAVGPRDLAGLVNLQHLIINNNQLIKVSVQAFDDFLLTLEDLDMSYNNLRR